MLDRPLEHIGICQYIHGKKVEFDRRSFTLLWKSLFFAGFSVYSGSQPEKSMISLKSNLIKFAGAVLVSQFHLCSLSKYITLIMLGIWPALIGLFLLPVHINADINNA